jgi:hypothetical protein
VTKICNDGPFAIHRRDADSSLSLVPGLGLYGEVYRHRSFQDRYPKECACRLVLSIRFTLVGNPRCLCILLHNHLDRLMNSSCSRIADRLAVWILKYVRFGLTVVTKDRWYFVSCRSGYHPKGRRDARSRDVAADIHRYHRCALRHWTVGHDTRSVVGHFERRPRRAVGCRRLELFAWVISDTHDD